MKPWYYREMESDGRRSTDSVLSGATQSTGSAASTSQEKEECPEVSAVEDFDYCALTPGNRHFVLPNPNLGACWLDLPNIEL